MKPPARPTTVSDPEHELRVILPLGLRTNSAEATEGGHVRARVDR